ncbi:hypothetical protein AV530_010931 [Patagioenas fasciata monilis]|uniref:Uncharacterized protein n=1 Tax=Patagioenas fasciata monilis TaxID=372326 RepID=A0A1V4K891_PATFA|nr:hypothetical protein AV530_010931 [Patagioenas fasciata monilis]
MSKILEKYFCGSNKGSRIRQIKGRDPVLLRVGLDKLGAESGSSSSSLWGGCCVELREQQRDGVEEFTTRKL